jgi:hypothetical protein
VSPIEPRSIDPAAVRIGADPKTMAVSGDSWPRLVTVRSDAPGAASGLEYIRDTCGHDEGDAVLREAWRCIVGASRFLLSMPVPIPENFR